MRQNNEKDNEKEIEKESEKESEKAPPSPTSYPALAGFIRTYIVVVIQRSSYIVVWLYNYSYVVIQGVPKVMPHF